MSDKPESDVKEEDLSVSLDLDEEETQDEAEKEADAAVDKDLEAKEKPKKEAAEEDKDEPRIPKSRLDFVTARAKQRQEAAEAKIRDLETRLASSQLSEDVAKLEDEISTLDEQYDEFITNGDREKARAVRGKLRELERKRAVAIATASARTEAIGKVEEYQYQAGVAALQAEFPALDKDSDEFDEELTGEVLELVEAYYATGKHTPAKALKMAADKLLRRGSRTPAASRMGKDRDQEARRRTADTVKRSPPDTVRAGVDTDKAGPRGGIDIMRMKSQDLDKIDPKVLAKMRGDYV